MSGQTGRLVSGVNGVVALFGVLAGDEDEVRLDVSVQACDGDVCLAPQTTHLLVPLTRKG
jgi:hypothetical protein